VEGLQKMLSFRPPNNPLAVRLLPARTDTRSFHECIYNNPKAGDALLKRQAQIRWLQKRLLYFIDLCNAAPRWIMCKPTFLFYCMRHATITATWKAKVQAAIGDYLSFRKVFSFSSTTNPNEPTSTRTVIIEPIPRTAEDRAGPANLHRAIGGVSA
jgi:hypothetical protein